MELSKISPIKTFSSRKEQHTFSPPRETFSPPPLLIPATLREEESVPKNNNSKQIALSS
jgi:hypothetical protein